jgi:8-oxo-dGTP pyrophosphatase MutT (NUDIX family)
MTGRTVRAAGGVVTRAGEHGPEVLLVHRPRYDDWSLPKGKADPGEAPTDTAWREVLEETGYACRVGPAILEVGYRDHRDRPKTVQYYAMHVERGAFVPNDEVDAVSWCSFEDADLRLSYPHDRDVLAAARQVPW